MDSKDKVIQELAIKIAQIEIDNAYLKSEIAVLNMKKQEVETDEPVE